MDNEGVLRVRGRFDAVRKITGDVRRPIILPKDHHITHLIAASYHERYHHVGHETALNEMKQSFMIPQARLLLKTIRQRRDYPPKS